MSNYFRQLPDFDYVSRLPDAKISDYIRVKNLFKKGALREDIFQNVSFFTKYKITGDKRPDNVAFDFYEDSRLDWLVLTCNNIINVFEILLTSSSSINEDKVNCILEDFIHNTATLSSQLSGNSTIFELINALLLILPARVPTGTCTTTSLSSMKVETNYGIF